MATGMDYDAPEAYERLIEPRYAPIADALAEAARLRPGERVLELGALGLAPYPSAAPGRAVRRIERAGLERVDRRDLGLAPRFASVDEYLRYRRGFGVPAGSTRARHERYLEALRRRASDAAAADGSLTLGWTVTLITARRPRG